METTSEPTEERFYDVDLWPHQIRSVCRIDQYGLVVIIGGRGSGKSFEDVPRLVRWADLCTELVWGIFATTDTQLQTVLAPFRMALDAMGIRYTYESQAPPEWRERWDAEGIKYPAQRLRDGKFLILDTGAHFFTSQIINNAYTRAKSIEFNAILIQEGTEPGVSLNAVNTLFGACRCGKAKPGPDGVWRCTEPGHLHQLVLVGNTPLNDPTHWIYKQHDEWTRKEAERAKAGKPPFYLFLAPRTSDNPATGQTFDDKMRAMYDARTYKEQTEGGLPRNSAITSYHAFSEHNILSSLVYDPRRPLHMWFDFNATPAVAGWGHDLRLEEVPEVHRRSDLVYHGIIGELFSGHEPMLTEQVANALLEDPQQGTQGRCLDCGETCVGTGMMGDHMVTGQGYMCRACMWQHPDTKRFCSGRTTSFDARDGVIRAPSNWHGLAKHRNHVYIYGDATGGATHADATNPGGSIQILRDVFGANLPHGKVHFRIPTVNPAVRMRTLAMNRMLENGNRVRRLFVAEWCEAHIDDFREVIPDPKTGEPLKVSKAPSQRNKGDYWMRTDISDAAGYHVAFRWPAKLPRHDDAELQGPITSESNVGPLTTSRMKEPRRRE